ncbi:MAG: Fic family protein [Proteobacteria bacterium]|nr:Fic family protein [Pseudomonadota bacterium]
MSRSGIYIKAKEGYKFFQPNPLPPEPPLKINSKISKLLTEAENAIKSINTAAKIIPNQALLIDLFAQKEALLSSQIEGKPSSLADLLSDNGGSSKEVAVAEVKDYIQAMKYGLKKLKRDDDKLTLNLILEVHKLLMKSAGGSKKSVPSGKWRTTQNFIGGTNLHNARYIPPPVDVMHEALKDFEHYLKTDDGIPTLIRCALIHYQFETIHPFTYGNGNGRIGRLLITFYLTWKKVLDEPLLYLSSFLKTHKQEYYDRLMQVRNDGNYEAWIQFFLEGIVEISKQVLNATRHIQKLEYSDTDRLIKAGVGNEGLLLLRVLMRQPRINVRSIQEMLDISYSKANNLVTTAERLDILHQISGGKRNRQYLYKNYYDILSEGTDYSTD